MSKIGYAVFGTPKTGLEYVDNGLVEELKLGPSLYLNNAEITLKQGEKAILIRRISANASNPSMKNGILIAMYEYALPNGNNREGFIGCAICFKDNLPNANKMVEGLFYLFGEIKSKLDGQSRFISSEVSSWNIELPNPEDNFGLSKDKLNYNPLHQTNLNERCSVKLNNLKYDAASLLQHFCLNPSLHNIDFLYAVENDNSTINLTKIDFNSIFNHELSFEYLKNSYQKSFKELKDVKNEIVKKQDIFNDFKRENEKIKNEGISLQSRFDQLKRNKDNLENSYKSLQNEINKAQENLNSLNKGISDKTARNPKDIEKIKQLENKIKEENKNIEIELDKKEKSSNKFFKILLLTGFLSIVFMILSSVLGYFYFSNKKEIGRINEKLGIYKKQEIKQYQELYDKLNNTKDLTTKKELEKRQSDVIELLNLISKKGEIYLNSKLNELENDNTWMFWDFEPPADFNKELINKKSIEALYLGVDMEKVREGSINMNGISIEKSLEKYLNENNDLYDKLPEVLKNDHKLILEHFKWLIKKYNKDIDLKKIGSIKLPFYKKLN